MIEIYTDGSCKRNPGSGGFGVVIFKPWSSTEIQYLYNERTPHTTNNKEELKAIIHATEWVIKNDIVDDCVIYSDSSYCVNTINKWMYTWSENDWTLKSGKPVENLDLILTLYNYYNTKSFDCQVKKTSGHSNIVGNELADALATSNLEKFKKIMIENKLLTNI